VCVNSQEWVDIRSLGKRHPEDQDELEGVVECCCMSIFADLTCCSHKLTEPVDGVHGALKDAMAGSVRTQRLTKVPHSRQERIDDPVLEHHVSQNSVDNVISFQVM
jgi:hypothetical protein